MKTKQKHTPTPWKVLYETNIFGSGEQNAIANCGDREVHGIEQCKANAEFIVRAVNSHEALLEAAIYFREKYEAAMHDEYDFPNDPWSPHRGRHDYEFDKHVKAIAKAEGQP